MYMLYTYTYIYIHIYIRMKDDCQYDNVFSEVVCFQRREDLANHEVKPFILTTTHVGDPVLPITNVVARRPTSLSTVGLFSTWFSDVYGCMQRHMIKNPERSITVDKIEELIIMYKNKNVRDNDSTITTARFLDLLFIDKHSFSIDSTETIITYQSNHTPREEDEVSIIEKDVFLINEKNTKILYVADVAEADAEADAEAKAKAEADADEADSDEADDDADEADFDEADSDADEADSDADEADSDADEADDDDDDDDVCKTNNSKWVMD